MVFVPKNWFSNMFTMDEPLEHEGILYLTVENFFQAMKVLDWDTRLKIAGMSPYEAKKYCKNPLFVTLRPDWEDIKIKVMEKALRWKFKKGTSYYETLMRNDKPVIELNNWHDNFWGSCTCKKCGNRGKNVLGELIMRIRLENKK